MATTTSTTKTAAQIAGLFLATAIERIQQGVDPQARHNLENVGWANMFLSERQAQWLTGQLEREQRAARGRTLSVYVEVDGKTVGTWMIDEDQGRHGLIRYTLFESYVNSCLVKEK